MAVLEHELPEVGPLGRERLERQLADQRRARAALIREVQSLRARIQSLEGQLEVEPDEEVEALREQLRDQEHWHEAACARIGYLEARITELQARSGTVPEPLHAAPQPKAQARRLPLVAVAALVVVAGAVALVLALGGGSQPEQPARAVRAATPAPVRETVPCEQAAEQRKPVTCTTGTTLTIATADQAIALPDMSARVLSARLVGSEATVQLRVRNGAGARQPLRPQQVYLSLPGTRLYGSERPLLDAGATSTVTERFAFDPADLAALERARGRVDLGVVPFSEWDRERPRRLGVFRLDLSDGSAGG